jgi:hypothetical protein
MSVPTSFRRGIRHTHQLEIIRAELADDPMNVDTPEDLVASKPALSSLVPPPENNCIDNTAPTKGTPLMTVPDEIVLRIVAALLTDPKNGCKGVQALSLTCHRLHSLTTDPVELDRHMKTFFPWETQYLYSNIDWTIPNIKRFLKYEAQQQDLSQALNKYMLKHPATRMGMPRSDFSNVIKIAIKIIQAMQGLQDNAASYQALQHLPFPWLVALHYTSMVFGRKFVAAHWTKLKSVHMDYHGMWERQALKRVFLRHGPVDALKLLAWDKLPSSVFDDTVRKLKLENISVRDTGYWNPRCVIAPEEWITDHITDKMGSWLRENNRGHCEEAWVGTGFEGHDRICILACLMSWDRGVKFWID